MVQGGWVVEYDRRVLRACWLTGRARRRWLRELDGAVEPQVRSETRQAPGPGRRDSFPAATELRATMAAPGTQRERHENPGSEPERGGKEEKKRGRGDGFLEELEHEGGARGGWVRRRRRRQGERSKREKLGRWLDGCG